MRNYITQLGFIKSIGLIIVLPLFFIQGCSHVQPVKLPEKHLQVKQTNSDMSGTNYVLCDKCVQRSNVNVTSGLINRR